jgi:hypothetical protein
MSKLSWCGLQPLTISHMGWNCMDMTVGRAKDPRKAIDHVRLTRIKLNWTSTTNYKGLTHAHWRSGDCIATEISRWDAVNNRNECNCCDNAAAESKEVAWKIKKTIAVKTTDVDATPLTAGAVETVSRRDYIILPNLPASFLVASKRTFDDFSRAQARVSNASA